MKYYSTILDKLFDTPQECTKAEEAAKKSKQEEKTARALVEQKEQEFKDALKAYMTKYGAYIKEVPVDEKDNTEDLICSLFKTLFN